MSKRNRLCFIALNNSNGNLNICIQRLSDDAEPTRLSEGCSRDHIAHVGSVLRLLSSGVEQNTWSPMASKQDKCSLIQFSSRFSTVNSFQILLIRASLSKQPNTGHYVDILRPGGIFPSYLKVDIKKTKEETK